MPQSRTFWVSRRDWRSRSSALMARRRCFSSARRFRLAQLTAAAAAMSRVLTALRPLSAAGPPAGEGRAASGSRAPRPATPPARAHLRAGHPSASQAQVRPAAFPVE